MNNTAKQMLFISKSGLIFKRQKLLPRYNVIIKQLYPFQSINNEKKSTTAPVFVPKLQTKVYGKSSR